MRNCLDNSPKIACQHVRVFEKVYQRVYHKTSFFPRKALLTQRETLLPNHNHGIMMVKAAKMKSQCNMAGPAPS